ncbi:Rha family transcriptional regulator [Paenibacillus sp. T2-29]
MTQLVFIHEGQAVTDSLTVAKVFGKDHDHVMRDIRQQLNKLQEAGEAEWGVSNFGETQYQHHQNRQWYPKFDMTEDAFAIVAMSYTTPEAMKMKVKFLAEFKRMRQQLQAAAVDTTQLSPILQLLIQQEQQQQAIIERQDATDKRVAVIQETILQRDDDWRDKLNGMLNGAARRSGGLFRDLRTRSYEMLESRAKCDLNRRLRNLRDRLQETGATKTKIAETNRLDVIEADPKLKEIYTTIIKELSIGTLT